MHLNARKRDILGSAGYGNQDSSAVSISSNGRAGTQNTPFRKIEDVPDLAETEI